MAKKITKTEIKQEAQDQLLYGLRCGYSLAGDDGTSEETRAEMRKQMARVAKMFGYDDWPGSYGV